MKDKTMRLDKNEAELISIIRAVKIIDKRKYISVNLEFVVDGELNEDMKYTMDVLSAVSRCLSD